MKIGHDGHEGAFSCWTFFSLPLMFFLIDLREQCDEISP
jgi:hypothetical protein